MKNFKDIVDTENMKYHILSFGCIMKMLLK